MPELFPVIEGDDESLLTKDFVGRALSDHYEQVIKVSQKSGTKTLNDFEYFDSDMLEDFGIDLGESQSEWHSVRDGQASLRALLANPDLPDDVELKEELSQLVSILERVPSESQGWRIEHDI